MSQQGRTAISPATDLGASAVAEKENATSPPRVLIADDDPLCREITVTVLTGEGYDVISVENGQQVLEHVSAGGIDLVILDVVMPGINGYECCRLVKTLTRRSFLPVVLVTAHSDTESRVEGLRIGADDFIVKPFDEREMKARISAMLRIKRQVDSVAEARERLEQIAVSDELTGLYNFRFLKTRLAEEFKRAERYQTSLACLLCDLDHFKEINDRQGHQVGDQVLAEVARRLRGGLREVDIVGRYGGDEFMLLLPATQVGGALTVAERMWRTVRQSPVRAGGRDHFMTLSVGISLFPGADITTRDDLIQAADRAMYQAKQEGRDRVCVFERRDDLYTPESRMPRA